MSTAEAELMEITRELAPRERRELLQFGRALRLRRKPSSKARTRREHPGDAKWERLLADPRPKLQAYMNRILSEEKGEPLDFGKL